MAAEEPHMSGAAFDALIAHHFLFIPRISHLHNLVLLSMRCVDVIRVCGVEPTFK